MADPSPAQVREEAKEFLTTDATRGCMIKNTVYDPLLFAPEIIEFSAGQYLFLNHYRCSVPISEAAAKAGLSEEQAERFLDSPKARKWLADKARKESLRQKWCAPEEWYAQGHEWLTDGRKEPSKVRFEVWKEFGDRCVPKQSRNTEPSTTKIEITVSPEALERSRQRRASIEAQIVQNDNHG